MAETPNIHVKLTADVSAFTAALSSIRPYIERINQCAALFARFAYRPSALDSPGDQHIDRVCRQIATGVPGRDPALRLQVAADLAEILDRKNT